MKPGITFDPTPKVPVATPAPAPTLTREEIARRRAAIAAKAEEYARVREYNPGWVADIEASHRQILAGLDACEKLAVGDDFPPEPRTPFEVALLSWLARNW
jgi:hypothetical protein